MPPPKIHLRHATPTDIPQMVSLLIKAFSPTGPWFDLLFPAHLRTTPKSPSHVPLSAGAGAGAAAAAATANTDIIDKHLHADQIAWRTHILTHQLTNNPGHRHILAVQRVKFRAPPTCNKTSNNSSSSLPLPLPQQESISGEAKEEGQQQQEEEGVAMADSIVGWAHWYLASHDPLNSSLPTPEERQKYTERTIWGSSNPPGLDKSALQEMSRQGEAVEKTIDAFLLPRRRTRHDAVELHYLMVDPAHQRKGIGQMLLREGLDKAAEGKWDDAPSGSAMTTRDVYLRSTVEGRALYLAHGFQQLGEGMLFGVRQFPMVKTREALNHMPKPS